MILASVEDFDPILREFFPGWEVEGSAASGSVVISKRKLFSKQRIVFSIQSREGNEEAFADMLQGMYGFYAPVATEHEAVKGMFLAQIQRFTVAADVRADKKMSGATLGTIMAVAGAAHGLVFLPPSDMFDGRGNLVFNASGESDCRDHTVTGPADLLDRRVEPAASGEARKKRSNTILASRGVPLCASLPVIDGGENGTPRAKEEVAARTMGVLMAAIFGEIAGSEGVDPARGFIADMLEQYAASDFLSPEERAFIEDPDPDKQAIANFTWRYECAWVGMWALGFVEDLAYPDAICDVSAMGAMVSDCGSFETFLDRAALRESAAILDQADLIYRYDWACVDARINGRDAPAGLNAGVVMERHRMLNWLTRYMDADWDDVATDT